MPANVPLLQVKDVSRRFGSGERSIEILRDISFEVNTGETIALVGASGAGKSTLLYILGTLDRPSSGEVLYEGQAAPFQNDRLLSAFRNKTLGFVFQFHHLLPEFTALENAALPGLIQGWTQDRARQEAESLLRTFGLGHRLDHYPGELSGGEQQRVAVSRAVLLRPGLLLADEPTGNLDRDNGMLVRDLLLEVHRTFGMTVMMATHNEDLAHAMQRQICISDGRIAKGVLGA